MSLVQNKNLFDVQSKVDLSSNIIRDELAMGSGVLVLRNAYSNPKTLDNLSSFFFKRIKEEEQNGLTTNNLDLPHSNKRLWCSLNKVAEEHPVDFVDYYGNEWLHKVCKAWLGPIYQIISEVNVVVAGENSQMGHRDYPMGFYSKNLMKNVPPGLSKSAPFMSLQGVVIHHNTPIEMGPTRFVLGSQNDVDGYLTFRDKDEQKRFQLNATQFDLCKGDLLFFNPYIYHGAGSNRTKIPRLVNLIQISSGIVKPLEHLNFVELIKNIFPVLSQMSDREKVEKVCRVITDCWPFPTNFNTDPPAPDFDAGFLDKDWLLKQWENKKTTESIVNQYSTKLKNRTYSETDMNPSKIKNRKKFLQLIKDQSKVVIYPAGGVANDFTKSEFFQYLNVVAFSDKSELKIGKELYGIEIINPKKIKEANPSVILIAVSDNLTENVLKDLNEMNYAEIEKIFL